MPTATKHPLTEHLWQLGFRLEPKAERLPVPIVLDDEAFYTVFHVTAYPERGEARRHFSRKGPARAEVNSNLHLEYFLHEQAEGTTELKDTYTEKCAAILLAMFTEEAPTLTQPTQETP